jgi:adenylate cyclase
MTTTAIATLIVERSGGEKQSFALASGQAFRVGRADNNDLVLDDPGISRMHAVFSASPSGLVVNDLSSLNGTYVNGKRITTPFDLSGRDFVDIGPFKFTIQMHSADLAFTGTPGARNKTAQLKPVFVSLMVASVRGYSRFAQVLPQADVTTMYRQWFERLKQIVHDTDGRVDKVINDCVVALWVGLDRPAVAGNSVKAALELNRQTWELCRTGKWAHDQTHPWDCRVALHAGTGLIGTVGAGAGAASNFGVLGDTVNVAFSLLPIGAKPGNEIVVSEAAAEFLRASYKLNLLEDAGKGESGDKLTVYSIDPTNATL